MALQTPRLAILAFMLLGCFAARADETVSLSEYLNLANDAGLRIIFSTDVIAGRYQVTYDPAAQITLPKVQRALGAFDLELDEAAPDVWFVKRIADSDAPIDVPVAPPTIARPRLEEMVVTSSRFRLLIHDETRSTLMDQEELRSRPAIGNDVTRLVNQLPGSASVGISAQPRVRGGNEDETLILFDGVRLYEPFHFNSFNSLFSSFDSRIIDTLDFYSGGFPVELGDRLSAAMVIEPREVSVDMREVGVGMLTASYLQSHNDIERNWIVAARTSTLGFWSDLLVENNVGSPDFSDFFGRYQIETASGDNVSANLLWFGDDMEINNATGSEHATSHNSNTYLWLKWGHDWTETTTLNSWMGAISQKNDRAGLVDKPGQAVGNLDDRRKLTVYNLKQHLSSLLSSRLHLQLGWDYRYVDTSYDYNSAASIDPAFANLGINGSVARDLDFKESGHQGAAYSTLRMRVLDALTMEAGLRLDLQHYEHGIHARQLSPRVDLLLEPGPGTQLRLGWGEFTQAEGLHELKVGDGLTTFQAPQKATHTIAGLRHVFQSGLEIRLDMYRKRGLVTNAYFENLTNPLSLLPELQADRIRVAPTGFVAEGVELSAASQWGDYDWWANYTYSSVKDRIDNLEVRRSWDQAHSANIGALRQIGLWDVSVAFTYHSGWRTTPLTYDGAVATAGPRNSKEFGNYASLDAKVTRIFKLNRNELRAEFGLTNLANRENVVGFDYQLVDGQLVPVTKAGPSIAPFFDLYYRF